jgi:hypothetical protein
MTGEDLSQFPYFNLAIPAWQMGLYIFLISICMLVERYKLSLVITYTFTLYWAFFLHWGDLLASTGRFPMEGTLYLMFGVIHLILTLVAFFKEE